MIRVLTTVLVFLLLLSGPVYLFLTEKVDLSSHWRTAYRGSAKIAPIAAEHKGALIQVYAAHAYHWRGLFSMHTWIALKPKGAAHFHSYEVSLWSLLQNKLSISKTVGPPDRYWFGNQPHILLEISGSEAETLIPKVLQAIRQYPYPNRYHAWPGPNSNTFLAFIGRQVPELHLNMPPNALGKDFLPLRHFIATVPSHTGYVISLLGIFAVSISKQEGVQVTILGLNFGFNWSPFRVIWPGVGYLW